LRHCERVLDCGPYLRLATDGVKWLNRILAVAYGARLAQAAKLDVYEVE
jgi:hypothetical protein